MNRNHLSYSMTTTLFVIIFLIYSNVFSAVLINEVAPGVNGVSTAEFIELYNTGSSDVDLTSWTIARRSKTGTTDSGVLTLTGTIPAHRHYLITGGVYNAQRSAFDPPLPLGDLEDTAKSVVGSLSANNAQIGLKNTSGTLIDACSYAVSDYCVGEYVEGTSKYLTAFSSHRALYRNEITHADTNNNNADFIYPAGDYITPTNSTTAPPPALPVVVISEVAPGVLTNENAEFIELYNTTDTSIDLAGWKLARRGKTDTSDIGSITLSGSIPSYGCFLVTGGEYNSVRTTITPPYPIGDFNDASSIVVGALSSDGAQIGLKNASDELIDAVGYAADSSFTGAYVEGQSKIIPGSFLPTRSIYRNETTHNDTNNNDTDFTYPNYNYVSPTNAAGQTYTFSGPYPYLTYKNNTTNSIVINWWNSAATGNSSVEYGTTSSYGSTVSNSSVSNFHHIELTGLTPGTTYHYKINSSDGTVGQDETCVTAPNNADNFTFAVFGDTRADDTPGSQSYHDRHKAECDHIASKNIKFALHTGDLVNKGSEASDYIPFFWAEQNLTRGRALMPSMGNHEVQSNGLSYYTYFDLFGPASMPNNGLSMDSKARVYSFDYGSAHIVSLSSYQVNIQNQATWLDADLAAAKSNPAVEWLFVFMHFPIYTASGYAGEPNERQYWAPILDKYNVDMVFAGHNHSYERTYPIYNGQKAAAGTYYVTCGLGGAPFDTFDSGAVDAPLIEKWYTNKTLSAYITISQGVLTMQAISVDNTVQDTVVINKASTTATSWEIYQ